MRNQTKSSSRTTASNLLSDPAHLPADPVATYQDRISAFGVIANALQRKWNLLANARVVAALLAIALGFIAWYKDLPWLALPAALALVAFCGLVYYHRKVGRHLAEAQMLVTINQEGLIRHERNWSDLPLRDLFKPPAEHPYAHDLDVFGQTSLSHLIDTTATPGGCVLLRQWLLAPAAPAEVRSRQESVSELAPDIDWRQNLETYGRVDPVAPAALEAFLEWAEQPGEPIAGGLLWATRLLAIATLVLVILDIANVIDKGWLVTGFLNFAIVWFVERRSPDKSWQARNELEGIRQYRAILEAVDRSAFDAGLLNDLKAQLGGKSGAVEAFASLDRWARFLLPPGSMGESLSRFIAWNFNIGNQLDKWRRIHGAEVRGWLDSVAQVEALAALANLQFDQPAWAMPVVGQEVATIDGKGLGHPLLSDARRITNDVVVGPAGTFLLVTGSNMSGKSTLIRSIGINEVLAGAGGPACAASFQSMPVELWTSVRITDSLEAGISYYMAELIRLKAVVDAAEAASSSRPVLYLLDEILTGTNTTERHEAATFVIRTLVDSGSLGAVSTHDLALAVEPRIAPAARNVHFAEQVGEQDGVPTMSFDYRLHEGLARTTNALKLMEMVGFDLSGRKPLT